MDHDQLRTFLAVLAHASVTRAGEALHVRQSTVSFHIKALETATGSRLVDRGRGRVRPTPAGRLLRGYTERLVALRDEAMARLGAEAQAHTGRVTIAASTVAAEYLLPPVLAAFTRGWRRRRSSPSSATSRWWESASGTSGRSARRSPTTRSS